MLRFLLTYLAVKPILLPVLTVVLRSACSKVRIIASSSFISAPGAPRTDTTIGKCSVLWLTLDSYSIFPTENHLLTTRT